MPGAPLLSCLEWISPFYPFSFAREVAYAGQPATFWTSLLCSNLLACFSLALSSRLLPDRWQVGTSVQNSEGLMSRFLRTGRRNQAKRIKVRQRLLEINPVLWLMDDVPGVRWLTWIIVLGWGVFLSIATLISPRAVGWVYYGAATCGFLLEILVAGQACRFFAEARQNGSLELLLCTPIREGEILKAQWIALKRLFLWPFVAFLLLSFVVPAAGALSTGTGLTDILSSVFGLVMGSLAFVWFVIGFVADNFAVIWFGMWLALTMKKPQLAPAATILLVLVLPMCANRLADIFFILWGAIKVQNLRWIVAQQYQRAVAHGPSAVPANVPPIIVKHP